MYETISLPLRYELVRYQTIALLYRLITTADELDLPKPSATLTKARQQLEDNRYHVVVMGEAKRGKTTFINALIGRAVLPANAGMAMRQGVRLSRATQDAYRLRFEDGSHQDITEADVFRYGAQKVELAKDPLSPEKIIRCIEIEVPMSLLPEGISLWDTPDMAVLGATPTHMAQRFALQADAVVYVLDSRQPMGQPDWDFVEAILEVTPHIFFIQNNIDSSEDRPWEDVWQANQDILARRYANHLSHGQLLPVSSTTLLQAVQSGYPHDFTVALQTFLFQAVGRNRIADALMVAQHDHALSHQVLAGRLAALTETSQEELAALQQQAAERQQQFEAEWGPTGTKRQELLANLQKVITRGRQNFHTALQPDGEIDRDFQAQIQALKSIKAAKQLSEKLDEDIVKASTNQWLHVCEFTQNEYVKLMTPFFHEAVTLPQTTNQPDLRIDSKVDIEEEWLTKLTTGGREMTGLSAVASLPLMVLVGASVLTGPLGVLTAAATGLWGFKHGWTSSGKAQLNDARHRLSQHARSLLHEVWRYFFETELAAENASIVDRYFEGLQRFTSERIDALAAQKSSEAQVETVRLIEPAPLDETERQLQAQHRRQHIVTWETLGATLQQIIGTLDTLKHVNDHDIRLGLGKRS